MGEQLAGAGGESAASMRSKIASGAATPGAFRAALTSLPPAERDAWLDLVLGLGELPGDGPELPRGCVPYMPCPVDTVLRMVGQAEVQPADVFIDIGAGLGRAAALTHLLTGASAVGVEIQPELVKASRLLATSLNLSRLSVVQGDAARHSGLLELGSVFFLYCPFSGDRLDSVLAELGSIARARQIRVCCVDLPLPPCPWLTPVAPPSGDLTVYRSEPGSR